MRKLPEVVEAKEVMAEAVEWSVFTWMFQKSKVRETADLANAALDRVNRNVKAHWSSEIKAAYKQSPDKPESTARHAAKGKQTAVATETDLQLLIEKVKAADHAAQRSRREAEETFDIAERELNLDLAREGCKKAIHAWELHEKAIRLAEAVVEATNPED